MGRRHIDMDDFMQFALYMIPKYVKRIEKYDRKYSGRRDFHHHKNKIDNDPENLLIDKKFLMDFIKKNFLQENNSKVIMNKKIDTKKESGLEDPLLKKGIDKVDKIMDKAIDNNVNSHSTKKSEKENKLKKENKTIVENVKKKEKINNMYTSTTRIKVRYVETDNMGIAHHSNYYIWFEVARGDFIKKANITYKEIEEEGIMMPLVETYCKYIRAAKYDDDLVIETSVAEFNPVKISFDYRVLSEKDSRLLAKGKTTQTFINSNFKIVNLQKKYPKLWDKLQIFR